MDEHPCINFGYWGDPIHIEMYSDEFLFKGERYRLIKRCGIDGLRCSPRTVHYCELFEPLVTKESQQ